MNLFATYHGGGKGKGSAYGGVNTVYAYGTLFGTDIGYNSGVVTTGSTYRVLTANILAGDLLNVSYVNNADLQIGIAGYYEINWSMNIRCSIGGTSMKCGISLNSGTIHNSGQIGYSTSNTSDYITVSGTVIKPLSLNDRISLCFKAVNNTPSISVGDINLTLHLVKAN